MSRIKSVEVRNALPYVSHFVITKMPTQVWVPTGQSTPQGELYRPEYNKPGITVEITTYMGTVKGPARPYQMPLKSFYEGIIAELQEIVDRRNSLQAQETRTTAEQAELQQLNAMIVQQKIIEKIAEVQALVDDTNTVWAETVMLKAGIESFDDFWDEVVSAGLDLFPSWDEANTPPTGIPVYLKEMQIEARVPYEGAKNVEVTIGSFLSQEEVMTNTQHKLVFEDNSTRQTRLDGLAQYQTRKTQIETAIAETAESETERLQQLNNELKGVVAEIDRIEALEIGLLPDLLQTQAILTSLPTFLIAVIDSLREKHWPNLDMVLVQERVAANLQEMMATLNVPSVTSNSGSKSDDQSV